MLRSMLAALSVAMFCSVVVYAGDCGCGTSACGGGNVGHVHAWRSSCGNACVDPCNTCRSCAGTGCNHCCFPVLRGAVHVVAKVVNFVIPRPCCHGGCHSGCNSCGGDTWDPTSCSSCGAESMPHVAPHRENPFIEDMPPSAPTPAKDARHSRSNYAPYAVKASPQPTRLKPAATSKPAAKPLPRTVAKVSHAEQIEDEINTRLSDEDFNAAPAAPGSIRMVNHEEARELAPISTIRRSTNPLR